MFFRRKAKDTAPAAPVVAPPPRVAIPAAAPGEPDMRGLGRALWAKKTKIIGFTLLVTALAFVVVNLITPRYRSENGIDKLRSRQRGTGALALLWARGCWRHTADASPTTSRH